MKRSPLVRRGKSPFPRDEAFLKWVRDTQPCYICAKFNWVQKTITVPGHVVRTRGAGGGDKGYVIPLCLDHETLAGDSFHTLGRTDFARHHELSADLRTEAAEIADLYDRESP